MFLFTDNDMSTRVMGSGFGLLSVTHDEVYNIGEARKLLNGGYFFKSRRDPDDDFLFSSRKDDDLWFLKR